MGKYGAKSKSIINKFPRYASQYIPPLPLNELLRSFVMHCLTRAEDLREAKRALCFNAVRFTPEDAARMSITVPEAGVSPIPDEQVTKTLLSISLQEEYRIQKESLLLEQLGEADPLLNVPLHSAGRFDSAEVSSARLKATEILQKGVLDVTQSLLAQAAEAAEALSNNSSNNTSIGMLPKPKNTVFDPVNHYPTCRKLAILHSCMPKLDGFESPLAMLGHQLASARSSLSSTVASAQARRPPGNDLDALLLDLRADRGVARSMLRLAGTFEKAIQSRSEAEGMAAASRIKTQMERNESFNSNSSNSASGESVNTNQPLDSHASHSTSAVVVSMNMNSKQPGEIRSQAAAPLIRPKGGPITNVKKTQQGAQAIRRQARSETHTSAAPPPWRQKADNSVVAAYGKGGGSKGANIDLSMKPSKPIRIKQIPALDLNRGEITSITTARDSLDPQLRLQAGNLIAAREALYTAGSTESVSPMHPHQGAVNIPLTITGLPGEQSKQIGIVPTTGQYELQLQRMNMQLQFQRHLDSLQTQAFSSPSQGGMSAGTTSFSSGRYTTLTDVVPPPQNRPESMHHPQLLSSRLSTGSSMTGAFGSPSNAVASNSSFPTSPYNQGGIQQQQQQQQQSSSYSFENSTLSNAVADARARLGMLGSSSSFTAQSQRLLSAMASANSVYGNATPGGSVGFTSLPGSTSNSSSTSVLNSYTNPYASASSLSVPSGLTPRRLDPLNVSNSVIVGNNSPKDRLINPHSIIAEESMKDIRDKNLEDEEEDDLKVKLSQLRLKSKQHLENEYSHHPITIHHPLTQEELKHKEIEERIKQNAAARSLQKNLRRLNKIAEKKKLLEGSGFSATIIRVKLETDEHFKAGRVIYTTLMKKLNKSERARKKELDDLQAKRKVKVKVHKYETFYKKNSDILEAASEQVDTIDVFDNENLLARDALQKKLENDSKKALEASQIAASKLSPTQASFKLPRDYITVLSDNGNEVVGYLDTRTGHRQREHPRVQFEQKEIAKRTALHLTMFDEASRQNRRDVETDIEFKRIERIKAIDKLYNEMSIEETDESQDFVLIQKSAIDLADKLIEYDRRRIKIAL